MVDVVGARLAKAVANGRAGEVSAWLRVLEQFDAPTRELIEMAREERRYQLQRRTDGPHHPDSPDTPPP
ncbi:MAG: hypothetical protein HZY74_09590 [Brevundimonas sp.]|nr:MAG: hypothetical protein HZY74_09590 [Brevundimonas sp.]